MKVLHRCCRACRSSPGYITLEKQAMFTCKQQLDGVSVLPFIMAILFAIEDGLLVMSHGNEAATTRDASASSRLILDIDNDSDFGDDGYDADVEAAKVDEFFKFDWARYRRVWHDTPIDRAIVEVFAEYATLYARIRGQVRSSVPPAMTLLVGLSIAEQASRFIVQYVTPVLGAIESTKIHKVLRHVMDAIRWHGHLQNGNTAENESTHKHEKPFYGRTNKHVADFTRQLVVFARGAEAVLERLDAEDGRSAARRAGSGGGRCVSGSVSDSDEAPAASVGVNGAATSPAPLPRAASAYHLDKMTVSELKALPDMADVGRLLPLNDRAKVAVLWCRKILATMDCGAPNVQTMRASPSFAGGPWFDSVRYRPVPDIDMVFCRGIARHHPPACGRRRCPVRDGARFSSAGLPIFQERVHSTGVARRSGHGEHRLACHSCRKHPPSVVRRAGFRGTVLASRTVRPTADQRWGSGRAVGDAILCE